MATNSPNNVFSVSFIPELKMTCLTGNWLSVNIYFNPHFPTYNKSAADDFENIPEMKVQ